jgi:hypothetical protein
MSTQGQSDIEAVIPSAPHEVTISTGYTFTVSELTVRLIPQVLRLLDECEIRVTENGFDLFGVYKSDGFISMLELIVGESIQDVSFADLNLITGKVFEVNRDFFALAVLRATASQTPTDGATQSNS